MLKIVDSRWAIIMAVLFFMSSKIASCSCFSVSESRALVASSNTMMGASSRKARAMAMRCLSPPDSFTPRSPTIVSNCSGKQLMNSRLRDFLATSIRAVSEMLAPKVMLSLMER